MILLFENVVQECSQAITRLCNASVVYVLHTLLLAGSNHCSRIDQLQATRNILTYILNPETRITLLVLGLLAAKADLHIVTIVLWRQDYVTIEKSLLPECMPSGIPLLVALACHSVVDLELEALARLQAINTNVRDAVHIAHKVNKSLQ